MSTLSLEFLVFLFLLLLIAAALDLWVIRAWKRRRGKAAISMGKNPIARPKADRWMSQKAPAESVLKPAVSALRAPGPSANRNPVGKTHQTEVVPLKKQTAKSALPRGGKKVPQQASLSIPGKSGRLSHVDISMDIPEGESIRLTLESVGGGKVLPASRKAGSESVPEARAARAARPAWFPTGWGSPAGGILAKVAEHIRSNGRWLFTIALILYLATRLIGLTKWPIYFFTDEAVQTNFAAELADRGFVWNETDSIPVFFENAGQYEMNLSVYVQLVPYLIFGKSVFVTRAVSVLITLLGMAALGWILRRAFHLPLWWSGVLLLSIIPVWFLHSRTAFEPGESIAYYALFLYFYMRYREDTPWMLLPALLFGALSAYTYSPSQVMVAVTGALLLVSDIRYHLRHKWIALAGLGFLVILALPYLWFLHLHPDANRDQLAIVSSYWLNDISFADKLKQFAGQYLSGLDPRYWFLANPPEGVFHDIIRHLMKGYGHLSLWTFLVAGILLCLGNIRNSHFRTVLIALIAAPTGGAIAQITISRALVMVVPAALLTALGVNWLLALLERPENPAQPEFLEWWRERARRLGAVWKALRESLAARETAGGVRAFVDEWGERAARIAAEAPAWGRIPRVAIALVLFLLLGSANVYMLWDSLANGPTWYEDYELYGMQYGGEQLSSALEDYHAANPESNLIVSSSWANGADEIFRFFLPEGFPMRTGTVLEYLQNYIPIGAQDVFIMTSEEYGVAQASGKFSEIRIEKILNYPNGQPGFYFARLTYVPNIEELIAAEEAELIKPVEEQFSLGGETVRIVHSRFDMGELAAGFDGNPFSLIRSQHDNPLYLDMFFPAAHRFTRVSVRVGGAPTRFVATFYPASGGDPQVFSTTVERASDYRDVEILLTTPVECSHIRLEIETVGESEPTHVHVYEVVLEAEGWKSGIVAPSS
jgi:hypothetical protein